MWIFSRNSLPKRRTISRLWLRPTSVPSKTTTKSTSSDPSSGRKQTPVVISSTSSSFQLGPRILRYIIGNHFSGWLVTLQKMPSRYDPRKARLQARANLISVLKSLDEIERSIFVAPRTNNARRVQFVDGALQLEVNTELVFDEEKPMVWSPTSLMGWAPVPVVEDDVEGGEVWGQPASGATVDAPAGVGAPELIDAATASNGSSGKPSPEMGSHVML
ncbi:hypothetical protein BC830DRAFT_664853 [Chytriomyces sp. MP71]|nr:hypothetical protein BC830DRAFT_664853 [Chytriomyces sp. MP71]